MDSGTNRASALRWTVVGLTVAAIYVCWPLWPALVLAAWTAAILRPVLVRLERVLKGRRRAAAALALVLFLLLALPLTLVVLAVLSGGQELARAITESPSAKTAVESLAAGTGGAPSPQVPKDLPAALDLLQRYGAQGANVLANLAGAAARGFVALFIYFGGAFVFLLEGPNVWAWCRRHSPLKLEQLERLAAAFQETGRGLLVGVGLTSATQGLVATIVYAALGVPRWWILGPITGLTSIVPLVGTAVVWVPITAGLFLSGHPVKGVILAVLGIGVIGTIDNVLRPLYARMGALKMPMYLLFVAVFGGIAALGKWGAILGPVIVRLWMEALVLRREAEEPGAATPVDGPSLGST